MRAVKNDFKGTSCQLSLCDLDEACPFFSNCHHIWLLHAPAWEVEAMRSRPASQIKKGSVPPHRFPVPERRP